MFCFCLAKRCFLIAVILVLGFLSFCRTNIGIPKKETSADPASLRSIPKKIWQINPWEDREITNDLVPSWIVKNTQHTYTLLASQNHDEYVRAHYSHDPFIVETFLKLRNPGLKSDFLRYLVIAAEGGVYTDLDTENVQPIDQWIPSPIRNRARVIIGIEYDQLNNNRLASGMYFPVQFCQWTFAATRDHPLMLEMVKSVAHGLRALAEEKESTLEDLEPDEDDILRHTGPAKFSKIVYNYLSTLTGTDVAYKDISGLRRPRLYHDVLIMPIDSFGTGLPHSGSSSFSSDSTLILHHFHSTWRDDLKNRRIDSIRPAARWSFPEVADRIKFLDKRLV